MKFYRKLDNGVFGGVISGLSEELKIDLTLLRAIALLLFFISAGVVGLIYIILWVVLPAADSDTGIKEEVVNKVNSIDLFKDNKKSYLILGGIFILIGVLILFNFVFPMKIITNLLIPAAIIGIGVYFILKYKK